MTILDTLALLGDTPSAIAQTLANKGIVGQRCRPHACPIATFLREQGYEAVSAAPDTIDYAVAPRRLGSVQTPPPVVEFIYRFDARQYPELVAS